MWLRGCSCRGNLIRHAASFFHFARTSLIFGSHDTMIFIKYVSNISGQTSFFLCLGYSHPFQICKQQVQSINKLANNFPPTKNLLRCFFKTASAFGVFAEDFAQAFSCKEGKNRLCDSCSPQAERRVRSGMRMLSGWAFAS